MSGLTCTRIPVHFLFYMDGNKGLLSSVSISVSLNSITISSTDPRSVWLINASWFLGPFESTLGNIFIKYTNIKSKDPTSINADHLQILAYNSDTAQLLFQIAAAKKKLTKQLIVTGTFCFLSLQIRSIKIFFDEYTIFKKIEITGNYDLYTTWNFMLGSR